MNPWPDLGYEDWKDSYKTVHMWAQIVGKVRLECMPWQNHSWHASLYVSPRGFTTGSIPWGDGIFEIEFDFVDHCLRINSSFTENRKMALTPRSVADFYKELMGHLRDMGINIRIHAAPNEVEVAVPFALNEADCSYDGERVSKFWQATVSIHNVFQKFRSGFTGKVSPVHFFWGAFDLAVTRFSGRPAPLHPGGMPNMPDDVMQEAYNREVSSAGFWPGNDAFPQAAFYSYCYPTPEAFGQAEIKPKEAFWSPEMGEYFLTYDAVRQSKDPESMLMDFLVSTYEAAADTGKWDREGLEA